jgi:hypothetical protein
LEEINHVFGEKVEVEMADIADSGIDGKIQPVVTELENA